MVNDRPQRLPRIYSIDGLKVIGALIIFWWHAPLYKPSIDFGARMCEFFFVAAGFLYYYSHYTKPVPCTFSAMAEYVRKKLVHIYPIHLVGFIAEGLQMTSAQWLTADTAIRAGLHLSMLHAWSTNSNVFFGFNGVSWFLSALIFCYFIGAIVMRLMSSPRRSAFFFILFASLRLFLDHMLLTWPNQYFNLDLHISPMIRCLEFFCGMAVASFTIACRKNSSSTRPVLFTVFELVTLCLVVYMIYTHQEIWNRAEFVILFCLLVFVFSFDRGWISKFLSMKPFRWFASIQLEFYMFHTIVIRYIQPRSPWGRWDWFIETSLICFVTTLLFVCLYRLLLRKPLSRLFDLASQACFRFFRQSC